MHTASQTFMITLTPRITRYKERVDMLIIPSLNCRSLCVSHQLRHDAAGKRFKRHHCSLNSLKHIRYNPTVALLSDASVQFEEFSVSSTNINDVEELKISIEVSGTKTQRIFDDVFQKMVTAAQPIPGFRRVKGGKTPDMIWSFPMDLHSLWHKLI